MAEGVRIVPRADLNWPGDASVCITNHSRPRKAPDGVRLEDIIPHCQWCGRQHFAKTYLIHLTAGAAIVSTTVWAELQKLDDNPFVYANPVAEPPGQIIAPTWGNGHGKARPQLVEKFVMPIITKQRSN